MAATPFPVRKSYLPRPPTSGWGAPQPATVAACVGLIGRSPQMMAVMEKVRAIAPHYRTGLVTGETGTGKELIARALHDLSPVRRGPWVVVNCSAVVETLFESELFGHVRGAFTGADRDKVGLFELADGGTLFLDEIGDMPASTQAKLLRVLQNQQVQRVGSLTPRQVNVRIVAATNKCLRQAIAAGKFREDLFYRLSMVEIGLPSLRDRSGDLAELAAHFLEMWAERFSKPVVQIAPAAWQALGGHRWPGNVRELENVLAHGVMLAPGAAVERSHLPAYLLAGEAPAAVEKEAPAPGETTDAFDMQEETLIRDALRRAGGNQTRAARHLRTTRDRLRYKMKKYGLFEAK
jgi:transcriptional regulator with PAS, ATPase and Fis domain